MSRQIDITEILDKNRIGGFQTRLFVLCGLCLLMAGFDVQVLGYLAPAIIRDWQLAPAQMGPVLAAVLFGILIGSILCSTIADRIGRRPVLVAATLFFAILTLLTSRAESVAELRMLRFIAGIGLGGIMPNAVALIGEYAPKRVRVMTVLVVTNSFNFGAMMAGFVSTWLVQDYGWSSVLVVGGAIPVVIGILMFLWLPESLQFMVLRGKAPGKVAGWVRRIDKTSEADAGTAFVVHEQKAAGVPLLHLFSEGRTIGTVLLWVVNFMNLLNIYFLAGWLPTIVSSSYSLRASQLAGTTLQVGGVLGTFVFSWLIGRFGFIPILAAAFVTATAAIAIIGRPALTVTPLFVVVFVSGFCILGSQAAINALGGSYYPTDLRSTGVGAALGIGRIGGILGPSIAGAFIGAGWMPREIFHAAAVPAIIAAVTILSLRRVMQKRAVL